MLAKLPVERDTLLKAADRIERDGHHKGSAYDPVSRNRFCLVGAITMEAGHHDIFRAAAKLFESHLGRHDIVAWNDAPERTKEEVVSALRAAALHGL